MAEKRQKIEGKWGLRNARSPSSIIETADRKKHRRLRVLFTAFAAITVIGVIFYLVAVVFG